MTPLHRLLRWAVAPEKLEYLEGDLMELGCMEAAWGRLPGLSQLRDVISLCIRHSRFSTPRWRIPLATAILGAVAVIGLLRARDRSTMTSILQASDPAGTFTLEFRGREIIAATMDGRAIEPARLQQRGRELVIAGGDQGRDFRIEITAQGIRWQARRPSPD